MLPINPITIFILFICICLQSICVLTHWEFAVTTPNEITFFDSNWTITTSAAHQFDQLSAITYDSIEDIIYFNDQAHSNSTIFSLRLSKHRYNHQIEEVLSKSKDENVQGIAFDSLERTLYWTDSINNHIYTQSLKEKIKEDPKILIKLDSTKSSPQGIAIDECRRKLYWTNAKYPSASIERASLDGLKREILIDTDISMPSGIVVDQLSKRLYWVDTFVGNKFSIESSALDGTDRVKLIVDYYNRPSDLMVDENFIYWTDTMYNAVWKISKNHTNTNQMPEKVYHFTSNPKGIIMGKNLLFNQNTNPECQTVIQLIKKRAITFNSTTETMLPTAPMHIHQMICLNNGKYDSNIKSCLCTTEFKGIHCEIPICYNYCIEGTCTVSSTGFPQCICYEGFEGDRCERDLCNGYCLNGGRCSIEQQEPICHCSLAYHGRHCETMNTKNLCQKYCENGINEFDDLNLAELCGNCSNFNSIESDNYENHHLLLNSEQRCTNNGQINKTAILLTSGVIISLGLIFLIVKTLRRHYAPLRPKIKKTYVVRKNLTKTPLTCRPTTEQCEITIENCCNMNICDTPCFDPKTLQQEITRKEDKRSLVNNMEGDLY